MLTMRASHKITLVLVTVHVVAFLVLAVAMFLQAQKDVEREQVSAFATAEALMAMHMPAAQLQSVLMLNRHLDVQVLPTETAVLDSNHNKHAQLRYLPNDGSNLQVIITQDKSAEFDEIRDTMMQVSIVFLLSLLTSLLLLHLSIKARLQPLRRLCEGLASVQKGNYQVKIAASDISEINQLINHYETMAEGLATKQMQVTELRGRLAEIQERERQAMARELHDNIGQLMTGIAVQVYMLKQQHQQPNFVVRASEHIQTMCEEIQLSLRQMTQQLYPVTLGRMGLISAIHELCARWQEIHPLNIRFNAHVSHLPDDATRDMHIYRIIQEAMSNTIKHARARTLSILLTHDEELLTVVITDDGKGLDTQANPQGLGLASMRDRASLIQGHIRFERTNVGTRIVLIAPLNTGDYLSLEEQTDAHTYR